MSGDVMSLSVV